MSALPHDNDSLWRRSAPWRWNISLAALALGLGFIGAPWQQRDVGPLSAAKYTPVASDTVVPPPPVAATGPVAGGTETGGPRGSRNSIYTGAGAGLQRPLPVPAEPAVGAQQSPGSVTWNSVPGMGAVSGGGLIAAHCCAGAFSTVWASRGVFGGRHYWELVLSTAPGEQNASTWTGAGIAANDSARRGEPMRLSLPGVSNGRMNVEVGRDKSIRTGDVLMFALDADRKLGYWGVNGQWRNGTPGHSGGTPLEVGPGEQLKPFVTLSSAGNGEPEGDRWLANFGGRKFRFALPAGFDSYGSSGGTQAAAASPSPTARPEIPGSMMGKQFQGSVTVAGKTVPLPEGDWVTLAFFKGSPPSQSGDAMLLGRILRNKLTGLVAITAQLGPTPNGTPKPHASCARQDLYFQDNSRTTPDTTQCWWVNHATSIWQDQPLFRAAHLELNQRKIDTPSMFLNVGFHRATLDGFATVFYLFDPADEGIASRPGTWGESEWHKDRLASDSVRAAYAAKLVTWGRDWAPVFFATR